MSPEVRRRRRSRSRRRVHRQLQRQWERHPRRTVLAGAGVVALLGAVWAGWVGWATAQDLAEVEERATVLRSALVRGDADGAAEAMRRYQDAAGSAASRTDGPTWSLFEAMPLVGDDAEGLATVSRVLADIGRDGLPPVVEAADQVTAEAFQPQDKVFPLRRIAATAEPAAQSESAFAAAAADLAAVDSTGFVAPLRDRFDGLRLLVEDGRSALDSAYRASRLMPALLGAGEPRHYLLVLQNNAEARSTGGLPGSLSLIRADDGRVDIVEQKDMAELEGTRDPVLPLTSEERQVFGELLGTVGVDATLTPDVPRVAELIRARWELFGGERVDGVFLVDPVAVSYLLAGTGPVPVPGEEPVTRANVVRKVENEIYLTSRDPAVHSAYQNAVAKAVFNTFADGRGDTAESIRGLVSGVTEGRVRMHLFGERAQAHIAGTKIAGEFVRPADSAPQVGLYLNDAGPTKMQFYLRSASQLFSRSCDDGRQRLAGSLRLHNQSPPNPERLPPAVTAPQFPGQRAAPGHQVLVAYLTSPIGGRIEEVALDGQVVRPVVQRYAGRELATLAIHLAPGQRQDIDFVVWSGPGQTDDAALEVTPGAAAGNPNAVARSACSIR